MEQDITIEKIVAVLKAAAGRYPWRGPDSPWGGLATVWLKGRHYV